MVCCTLIISLVAPSYATESATARAASLCQCTDCDYDPSGKSQFLSFFVQKDDELFFRFRLYCNGRDWDNNVAFSCYSDGDGTGYKNYNVFAYLCDSINVY